MAAVPYGGAAAAGRHASLVVDANTGRVLHAQQADEPRYPASLTKMMTLYIVFELMEQHRLDASTRIKISEAAANTAPSKLGLEPGSEIALGDAIRALITKSANDVAVAVAEHIAGSEAKFARLMTQKARAIGMHATVFKNAHGLSDPEQITTARDMVTLALRLNDEFPHHYRLFALRAFNYNGATFRNHNTLLNSFEGTDGIKTGYTAASGFNLAASVRRDGKHIIGVVFGGRTASTRNVLMRALLRRALAEASTNRTRKPMLVARATDKPWPARGAVQPTDRQALSRAAAHVPSNESRQPSSSAPAARRESIAEPLHAAAQAEEPRPIKVAPIEIARVRPVLVAPRARVASAGLASASMPQTATADAGAVALPRVLAEQPSGQPGRGAPPSNLEVQADRLARGQPAVAHAVTAALPGRTQNQSAERAWTSPPAPQHGFAVQVGAYSSEAEAMRQLQATRTRASDLLSGRSPVSQPVQHAGKQLYRARFSGFDSQTANSTCQELKRRQIDCHVAKIE